MSGKKSKNTLGILISSFLFFIFGASLMTQILAFDSSSLSIDKGPAFAWSIVFCALSGLYLRLCIKERAEYFRQNKLGEEIPTNIVDTSKTIMTEAQNLGIECSYLGGSGYFFHESEKVRLFVVADAIRIALSVSGASIDIPFTEIHEIEISGPGTTTNNAGISGGGFGLEGFVKGAVTAALINAATTKSSTNTFARMLTITGELYLHTSQAEPAQLKIKMSQVFVYLANKTRTTSSNSVHGAVAEEITKLHKLKQDGLIDDDEYKAAKSKLLGISV